MLELCSAGGAGISLVEEADGSRHLRWLAVAGGYAGMQGKLTAWQDCPCALALEARESLFLVDPSRTFEALGGGPLPIMEGLIVPIEAEGVRLGAIWVMSHRDGCRICQVASLYWVGPKSACRLSGLARAVLLRRQRFDVAKPCPLTRIKLTVFNMLFRFRGVSSVSFFD